MFECAHIVEAIAEFDQDNPQIVADGEQHLAEILCLRLAGTLKFNFIQLGYAIYQFRHLQAEFFLDVQRGDWRIFHYVVQECSQNRRHIHVQVCEYARNRNRVRDIRFTGFTHYPLMGFVGVAISFKNLFDILRFEILLETYT